MPKRCLRGARIPLEAFWVMMPIRFNQKGTGKFKGITGSVVAKGKTSMAEKTREWEAESEIR